MALERAGGRARGTTAYVTLMPCAHFGRTPPCADALIRAGVRAVVAAWPDPNPVAHGGHERLAAAGVPVRVGLMADRAAALMRGYLYALSTGRPFVTLKYAMTLDGRIATRDGDSQWISGEVSRRVVHRWRARVDAVLVGSGTVALDDPRLNVRLPDATRHPLRVVFDTRARLSPTARLFTTPGGRVVVATGPSSTSEEDARKARLRDAGATVMTVPLETDGASLDTAAALSMLTREHGVHTVLCEGGAELAGGLFRAGCVDEVAAFVAPKLLGGRDAVGPVGGVGPARMDASRVLNDFTVRRVGGDFLLTGLFDLRR